MELLQSAELLIEKEEEFTSNFSELGHERVWLVLSG